MGAVRESGADNTLGVHASSASDRELIDRICAGSHEATAELLINRYGALLQFLARKYDEEVVSDLYNHLFTSGTWARLRKWDGQSKFSTWLGAVVHNLYAERMRTRGREAENLRKFATLSRRLSEEDCDGQAQPASAMAAVEDRSLRISRILRALESLSPRDQLVVSLLDLRDPPEKVEVVAEMLGRTVEAVRVARTRARQRLKEALEREGGECDD